MASDYFAALMRASGLQTFDVAPAAEAGGLEQHELRSVAPELPASSDAASATATGSASDAPSQAPPAEALPRTAIRHAGRPTHAQPSAPGADRLPPATSSVGADARVPLRPEAAASVATPVAPPPLAVPAAPAQAAPPLENAQERQQALLRVALNWVSHGPLEAEAPMPQRLHDDGRIHPVPGSEDAMAAPPPKVQGEGPPAPLRLAPRPVRAQAAPAFEVPARPGSTPQRGGAVQEAVQVSIGSIHLRVDAPPAPVQASTAPAPPPARPPAPSRGDFERRLLRRL